LARCNLSSQKQAQGKRSSTKTKDGKVTFKVGLTALKHFQVDFTVG
jgi:hypothetical protein